MPKAVMDIQVDRALARAEELLESGWTRAAFARDAAGQSVHVTDPTACQWCLSGAVAVAVNEAVPILPGARHDSHESWSDLTWRVRKRLHEVLRERGSDDPLAVWNDHWYRRKSQVLGLVRDARGRDQ